MGIQWALNASKDSYLAFNARKGQQLGVERPGEQHLGVERPKQAVFGRSNARMVGRSSPSTHLLLFLLLEDKQSSKFGVLIRDH